MKCQCSVTIRNRSDFSLQVSTAAKKCATALCSAVGNADLDRHIAVLVECMSNPSSVPECMKALSSTTFVIEVTAPALAVLVPLLMRALNDRSMEVQRRTVVVIDNLFKLVCDPRVAALHLSILVDGVEKIKDGAAFPEVRAFAESAYNTLIKAGASSSTTPAPPRDMSVELKDAKATMASFLPSKLIIPGLFPALPKYSTLNLSLDFQAEIVADLVHSRRFSKAAVWQRCIGDFMTSWFSFDASAASAYAESVRQHYDAIDKAKYATEQTGGDDEGEILCNTLFSLAYGALLLLSHTTLRLIRGRRYGILGPNGSGKTTLMRQLKDSKVENFPPQSELRCVMVEHALQGENTSLTVVDFVASGESISNLLYVSNNIASRCSIVSCNPGTDRKATGRGRFRPHKATRFGCGSFRRMENETRTGESDVV